MMCNRCRRRCASRTLMFVMFDGCKPPRNPVGRTEDSPVREVSKVSPLSHGSMKCRRGCLMDFHTYLTNGVMVVVRSSSSLV